MSVNTRTKKRLRDLTDYMNYSHFRIEHRRNGFVLNLQLSNRIHSKAVFTVGDEYAIHRVLDL